MTIWPPRRIGDTILTAFDQAIEQKDVAVAELMQQALELVLTRRSGLDDTERRTGMERMVDAYSRLVQLKRDMAVDEEKTAP